MANRILIVEDDQFLRELIVQKLTKENFDIVEAQDGEEGIKMIQTENPDIVLLDLILPGIDGFEVLSRAKNDPKTAHVPIIILSNLGQEEDVQRGLQLGAVDYMVKAHFTPGEIVERVRSILDKGGTAAS